MVRDGKMMLVSRRREGGRSSSANLVLLFRPLSALLCGSCVLRVVEVSMVVSSPSNMMAVIRDVMEVSWRLAVRSWRGSVSSLACVVMKVIML